MTIFELISIIGVLAVGIGLIVTWVRNGRSQASSCRTLKSNVKSINGKLDDPNTGLGALSKKMGDFNASFSSS